MGTLAREDSADAACLSSDVADKVETATQICRNGGRPEIDYLVFAAQHLRIRTKSGAIAPFMLNRAQRFIHEKLEAQNTDIGKVRALILKGRQQGCSTYIAGRFYHRSSRNRGQRVFILTHEEQATQNLFEIVSRFHEHCLVKPSTGTDNARELTFDRLDSGYRVGTAGTRGIGRSSTLQLFHGSEVAFWPFAETHLAGILQAVADRSGTEAIMELDASARFKADNLAATKPITITTILGGILGILAHIIGISPNAVAIILIGTFILAAVVYAFVRIRR